MKKPELYANSIKNGVKEKICKGVDWTQLGQNGDKGLCFVDTTMHLQIL